MPPNGINNDDDDHHRDTRTTNVTQTDSIIETTSHSCRTTIGPITETSPYYDGCSGGTRIRYDHHHHPNDHHRNEPYSTTHYNCRRASTTTATTTVTTKDTYYGIINESRQHIQFDDVGRGGLLSIGLEMVVSILYGRTIIYQRHHYEEYGHQYQ